MLTCSGSVRLFECLEKAPHLFFGQANARVADRETNQLALLVFFFDASLYDDFPVFRKFHRIVAEVDEDLPQTQRVTFGMGENHGVDIENQL